MAFVLATKSSIKVNVKISIPEDNGRESRADLEVEYRKLSVSDTKELMESANSGGMDDEATMSDNILNIKGCKTPDGQELDYSAELLIQLMDIDYVRRPLVESFMAVTLGKGVVEGLRRKN